MNALTQGTRVTIIVTCYDMANKRIAIPGDTGIVVSKEIYNGIVRVKLDRKHYPVSIQAGYVVSSQYKEATK